MTPRRLYEVATKARELLDRDGWRQVAYGGNGGPRCAIGLLRDAGGCFPGPSREDRLSIAAIVGEEPFGITCWNDAPERTIDDVRSAFDALASLALSEMAVEVTP